MALLRQPIGQRILRYASLDDLAIWAVLALILMDWQRVGNARNLPARLRHRQLRRATPDARVPVDDRWYLG
jgi:hypothetical protein